MKTSLKNSLHILSLFSRLFQRAQLLQRREFGFQLKRREKGSLYRLQVYERVGTSLVELYERVGKSAISVDTRPNDLKMNIFMAVKTFLVL